MTRWTRQVSPVTWILLSAAIVSVGAFHGDRMLAGGDPPAAVFLAGDRVFPRLPPSSEGSELHLHREGGMPLRIVFAPGRHALWSGEILLGPIEEDTAQGLWSTLRLATRLREVADDASADHRSRGRIEVVGSFGRCGIDLGESTADAAGIYGRIDEDLLVVEPELASLLEQDPRELVAATVLPLRVRNLQQVSWGGIQLQRSEDSLWRLAEPADIADSAVFEAALDDLLAAEFSPQPQAQASSGGQVLLQLVGNDGSKWILQQRPGSCPEGESLIDRGAGWPGCVESERLRPPEATSLVESKLLPHGYGRILAVTQVSPEPLRLRRNMGGWIIEGDPPTVAAEPEVYTWYEALRETTVEFADASVGSPELELVFETDAKVDLRLRCKRGAAWLCRRDEGPWLKLAARAAAPSFSRDSFGERSVLQLRPGDLRAVEILGEEPRQSLRQDLGVWRLDAPDHPWGDAALDSATVEELVFSVTNLRAEAWIAAGNRPVLRSFLLERAASAGESPQLELDLHPGCILQVRGQSRAARIDANTCARLTSQVFGKAPAVLALERAQRVTLEVPPERWELRRKGDELQLSSSGEAAERAQAWLQAIAKFAASRLRSGRAQDAVLARLEIQPLEGAKLVLLFGREFLQVQGQSWHLAGRFEPPTEEP